MSYLLRTIGLAPVIVPQGIWTNLRVPTLPEPPGARVSVQPFGAEREPWSLGAAPLTEILVPYGPMHWRVSHDGYQTAELISIYAPVEPFVDAGPVDLDRRDGGDQVGDRADDQRVKVLQATLGQAQEINALTTAGWLKMKLFQSTTQPGTEIHPAKCHVGSAIGLLHLLNGL